MPITPIELSAPYEVTKPGIYLMPDLAYREDPVGPAPSLNQSLVKVLLEKSPAHAWAQHPRLNIDMERDDPTKYDIGNIAHTLMLGRGRDIEVLQFDNWTTKAAKEARAAAKERNVLAVLEKDYELASEMVKLGKDELYTARIYDAFLNGWGEVVLVWKEKDVWLRCMMDWLPKEPKHFYDYKTTKQSAAPHMLGWKAVNDGWDIQAAMIERGLNVLDPENAGRRKARFVCQEAEEPYALTVMQMRESWLTMGRKKLAVGIHIWRECMQRNQWPAYPRAVIEPEYPTPAESAFLAREETMTEAGIWNSTDNLTPDRVSRDIAGPC